MDNRSQILGGQNLKPELKEIYDKIMNISTNISKNESAGETTKIQNATPASPASIEKQPENTDLNQKPINQTATPAPKFEPVTGAPAAVPPASATAQTIPNNTIDQTKSNQAYSPPMPPGEAQKSPSPFVFSLENDQKPTEEVNSKPLKTSEKLIAAGIIIFIIIYTFVWLVGLKVIKLF